MRALRAHTEAIAAREDDARNDLESVDATQRISGNNESSGVTFWRIDNTGFSVFVFLFGRLQASVIESDPRLEIFGSARIRGVGPTASGQAYDETRASLTWRDGYEDWDAVEDATAEDYVANMTSNLPSSWYATRHEMVILQ